MKNTLSILILFILLANLLFAQNSPALFKNSQSMMPVGAYYYPEHWPKEQWERDLKKMAELGFEFTHFGEFAWSRMEPEEGNYDFGWLDTCIALADKYNLKVILCTPTPTPPAWLTQKHPEILSKSEAGFTQSHGSRLHVSYNHPTYLFYTEKIVKALAERYGQDERVSGWQIDNEPHFGQLYDYSSFQEKEFRLWLRQKYKTTEALNKAWGTAFWSQTYNHFDQIPLPNANRVGQGLNPHHRVDFRVYMGEALASALRFQTEILRKYVKKEQWITTNYAYFKFLPPVDPFLNRNDFDFASHTMYLTSQYLNDEGGALAHRLGSGLELSFSQEMAHSVNGKTGIMELQPGQINWGKFNPQPLPGAVRMWLWHAFALGDEFACAYRFRQPLYGGEQTHYGILMTDGISVQRGGKEYVQAIQEIKTLKHDKAVTVPNVYKKRKTAFLWKQTNLLDLENQPHHNDWNTWQHYYDYYSALKTMGASVDFITEEDNFDPREYPFMVASAYQRINQALIEKWWEYVQKGGHLILTCRTGTKDSNGWLWESKLQEPIWDLIGAEIAYYDHLPANRPGKVMLDEKEYNWHIWADIMNPKANTESLLTYSDQFYQGKTAATTRSLGNGSVSYIGAWSDNGKLERDILHKIYQSKNIEILDLPPYVFVEWRNGYWVAVNYSSEAVTLSLNPQSTIIIGNQQLKPGGVTVWQDK